jgi:hypothetical protein
MGNFLVFLFLYIIFCSRPYLNFFIPESTSIVAVFFEGSSKNVPAISAIADFLSEIAAPIFALKSIRGSMRK